MRLAPVLALGLVLLSLSSARADGVYFSESLGGARVHDELGASIDSGVRFRIGLGVRRGHWAAEGFVAGLLGPDNQAYATPEVPTGFQAPPAPDGMFAYGIDVKYLQPVSDHVEVYLRGRASRGALTGSRFDGYAGRGLGAGAGIQLKGKVPALGFLWAPLFFTNWGPKVTAALYLDTGYDFYRFHQDQRAAIDAQISTMMFGFAVGSDF